MIVEVKSYEVRRCQGCSHEFVREARGQHPMACTYCGSEMETFQLVIEATQRKGE